MISLTPLVPATAMDRKCKVQTRSVWATETCISLPREIGVFQGEAISHHKLYFQYSDMTVVYWKNFCYVIISCCCFFSIHTNLTSGLVLCIICFLHTHIFFVIKKDLVTFSKHAFKRLQMPDDISQLGIKPSACLQGKNVFWLHF